MKNTRLLHNILFSAWMIQESFVTSVAPQVISLLKGKPVDFGFQEEKPFAIAAEGNVISFNDDFSLEAEEVEKVVAIVPIKGAITKNDTWCGPKGSISLGKYIQNLDKNNKVSAIVLNIDSPGGEASYLNTLANIIKNTNKPILASYSGLACSAAYYIASACDEIYAQEKLDIVGSIGTMITFADFGKFYEKQGVKIHEIYASQSTDKNKMFAEAVKGNYGPLRAEILDPYAKEFIDTVKENREGIDASVFTGGTYTSVKAQELGLIDGVKTFDQVIDRVNELTQSDNSETNIENKTQHKMNLENIENALGFKAGSIESQDGQISLSVENAEKLNALLVEQSTTIEANEEEATKVDDLTKTVETLQETVIGLSTKMEAFAGLTTTDATVAEVVKDDKDEVESWNSAENPNNKLIDEAFGKK